MIFVAATAIGLAVGRTTTPYNRFLDTFWERQLDLLHWVPCIFVSWQVALFLVRLRQPRPRLRRIFRQPGMIATCVCLLTGIITFVAVMPILFINASWPLFFSPWAALITLSTEPIKMAFVVGASWVTLALTGRWCCERGWIDRTGRTLGVLWFAGGLVEHVMFARL
ncbi:MAG TPA: hypothetical protein VGZ22_07330 [Isosphaeraceae bacterium]|nr:hypothetical protein [Isosphaeraceae bacterium]